ncbi:MAG TPA: hypothetical protein VNA25_28220 [Phycisphaerae bacterium]|nr:hypothetical protein [Phycisphaerae bacterium]HUT61742.1 hypothetical protein [Phycisphaerae bacterium]
MTEPTDEQTQAEHERRAPRWVVRCLRCGFTEPWGKYGVRLHARSWKKCTVGRCSRCGRICCHVIEKRKGE